MELFQNHMKFIPPRKGKKKYYQEGFWGGQWASQLVGIYKEKR